VPDALTDAGTSAVTDAWKVALTDAVNRDAKMPWWQTAVIYQIYPRSFQDSNSDGIGDLPGITARLEYVRWLGMDAIWLSPFYPSPMADFGYDVSNYTDVDPIFGSLADFDALVTKAHALGLRVLVDFVPNHTSDQHPWFRASRRSRTDPKRDWYVWKDAKPDGSAPNNWLSVMGGAAWEWDPTTGQYYLHSFLKEQPDLNWRNPAVRAAMEDVLRFWLAHGVDGFRIDAIYYIAKDPAYADAPPDPAYTGPQGAYASQLHLGHDKGYPDIHTLLREIRQVVDAAGAGRDPVTIGESHIWDWAEWASYYGAKLDELHFPFNFAFTRGPYTAAAARRIVDDLEAAIPPGAWPNYLLGNHDEPRIASRIGPERVPLAMLLLLTLRGTPTVYYGDELGMRDIEVPPTTVRDPVGRRIPGSGRDPERAPMAWDGGPNAGFCPPGVTPWLPLAADYRQVNVARERDDPRSLLTLTQRILRLRRAAPALLRGAYTPVERVPDDCFAYLRAHGDERYLIALNFGGREQTLRLGEGGGEAVGGRSGRSGMSGRLVLSTRLDREGSVDLATLRLRPYEGCLVAL
jgi:glycosidase